MKVVSFARPRQPVVLCVDDEPKALHVRRMVLESAGFNVLTAATASEAMAIVRAQRVHLVLTDYYLDGVTGGELARAIKDEYPHQKVAIYSGAVDLPDDAGHADTIITKADGVPKLVSRIHSLLGPVRQAA